MKKGILVLLIALMLVMTISVSAKKNECTTIPSGELLTSGGEVITTGFDEWGYNYQAHQFIGYYGNYQRPPQPVDWGYRLMMKWNDAWLSNKDCGIDGVGGDPDGKLDRHYGFDSYIGSGAWLTNHQSGEYINWDVSGEWIINVEYMGTYYPETLILTQSGTDITGVSLNTIPPASGSAFTIVSGSVTDNTVEIFADHVPSSLVVRLWGTIAADGSMSGDWKDEAPGTREGTWTTTTGAATSEPCKFTYFVKIVAAPADAYVEDGFWYTADGVEIGEVIWGAFAVIQEVETDSCAGLHGIQYNSPSPTGFGWYFP